MNQHVSPTPQDVTTVLHKPDPAAPAFKLLGPSALAIKAGVTFAGHRFDTDTPVPLHLDEKGDAGYVAGADYLVSVQGGAIAVTRATSAPTRDTHPATIGGFHFAPGGNATGRAGGDAVAQISLYSLWDMAFRPACPDPRGMVLVEGRDGRFWCDIYLTGVDHLANGTSALGVAIADGDDCPQKPAGGRYRRFDYEAAVAVMAHHGKGLLSYDEFVAAAFGVTERTAAAGEPTLTGLDAPRTSAFGIMQATGNMWIWGHDGDPDLPRASVFGGCWVNDHDAGSRRASVACDWPDGSDVDIGARGRGDHLQLG